MLVESHYAVREINSGIYGAMALDEHPSRFKNTNILKITDDGFTVYSQKINDNPRYAVLNFINMDYYYQCVGEYSLSPLPHMLLHSLSCRSVFFSTGTSLSGRCRKAFSKSTSSHFSDQISRLLSPHLHARCMTTVANS